MSREHRRISLVARAANVPHRDWDDASRRVLFVESLMVLRHAIAHGIEMGVDVERVIVDRAGNANDFLALIASLPHEFLADVVFIDHEEKGYLSAVGRGGNRVLYSLSNVDVRFYLEAHDLVTARVVLERPVLIERRMIA